MPDNIRSRLSAKDEALLILEYLENEHMSKTFLNFLEESQHLVHLRSRLYSNYEHPEDYLDDELEVNDFQAFFNLSLNLSKQTESMDPAFLSSSFNLNHPSDLFFNEDFLDVGLYDLISQTPPMDEHHDLPDTPAPSVPPLTTDCDDFHSSIEQLFAMQHDPLATPPPPRHHHSTVSVLPDTNVKTSFTKCIVVTQDFLQSMYSQQQQASMTSNNSNYIHRPKRRRRRLKAGKENHYQQRKIMPRTSPDHQ